MHWREASAAYETGELVSWPYLTKHHKEWIIAIVELKIEIANVMVEK